MTCYLLLQSGRLEKAGDSWSVVPSGSQRTDSVMDFMSQCLDGPAVPPF